MDVFVNSKPFEDVFEQYIQKNTKVKIADELNRRAANIIMKAMAMTPRTTPDEIKKDLGVMQIVQQRVIKSGKRKGQLTKGKRFFKPDPNTAKVFKIFNWRRKFRPDSLPKRLQGAATGNVKMKGLVDKFVKSARSSAGYIAAGWIPALKVFLTAAKGQRLQSNDASKSLQQRFKYIENNKFAKLGYGNLANPSDVVIKCTFGNAARGADVIAKEPLTKAINAEIADMKVYIEGKIMGLSGKEITALTKRSRSIG
jgi:hypothetical protein